MALNRARSLPQVHMSERKAKIVTTVGFEPTPCYQDAISGSVHAPIPIT